MIHFWRAGLVALAVTLTYAAPVAAQAQAKGDVEAGRLKANTCMGCHGISEYNNVYPTFHVPKLGGQHAEYLVSALHEYRTGARKHPTMHAQASSLSDQDIANIAAFLSQAPKE